MVIFPSGATIRLYGGGQAYERIRGIYLDGAVLDEYPLLNPRAWTSVVRPTLADYRGFAIISGTSNGDDHFHAVKLRAEDDPTWDVFDIKITDTHEDALSYEEQAELTRDMPADEYAREMLNAFDAPIEGAYYTEAMNALQGQKRVTTVPVDLSSSLITGWDIGIHDFTCIWIFQIAGKEIHFVDYVEDRGHKADALSRHSGQEGEERGGRRFAAHILPHDVEAREWAIGRVAADDVDGCDAGSDSDRAAGERRGWDQRGAGHSWVLRGLTSIVVGAGWRGCGATRSRSLARRCMTMRVTWRGCDEDGCDGSESGDGAEFELCRLAGGCGGGFGGWCDVASVCRSAVRHRAGLHRGRAGDHRLESGRVLSVTARRVAALFVEDGGCYFGLRGVDPWPAHRDARFYRGPHPIVAHPPCERWGRYHGGAPRKPHQYVLGDDGGLFASALISLLLWGGDSRASGAFACVGMV